MFNDLVKNCKVMYDDRDEGVSVHDDRDEGVCVHDDRDEGVDYPDK